MAALRSGSSSSSGLDCDGFDVPLEIGDLTEDCTCFLGGTAVPAKWPLASSKLISNALLRSASKLSSTRAFRGSMEP